MHWQRINLCIDKNKGIERLPHDDSCEKLRNLNKCNAYADRPIKRYAITSIAKNYTRFYAQYHHIINCSSQMKHNCTLKYVRENSSSVIRQQWPNMKTKMQNFQNNTMAVANINIRSFNRNIISTIIALTLITYDQKIITKDSETKIFEQG